MIQLKRGNIIWLRKREEIEDSDIGGPENPHADCFNHPVVVLRTDQAKTEATILTITSFGGTPLNVRHKNNPSLRLQYLPIEPSPPHPDNRFQLQAEGKQLHKPSYVCIRQAMTFSAAVFRPFGHRKLTDASCNILSYHASGIEVLNFVPTTQTTTFTPPVPQPYNEPYSLWDNCHSNGYVDTGRLATFQLNLPVLSDAFCSTSVHTRDERMWINPYKNPSTTPSLRSNGNGQTYGTFVSQSFQRSWQSQMPAHPQDPNSNKKPSKLAAVLTICLVVAVFLGGAYLGYIGTIAFCRWIWSEIQGTLFGKALAWMAQTLSRSAKALSGLVKLIIGWIRHRF